MAKGRKIDISDYYYEYEATDGESPEMKKDLVRVRHLLPRMLCDGSLGAVNGRTSDSFDFYKLYVIGEVIREAKDGHVILTQGDYDTLVVRIKEMSKAFLHKLGLMVARIMKAEEVELEEKLKV